MLLINMGNFGKPLILVLSIAVVYGASVSKMPPFPRMELIGIINGKTFVGNTKEGVQQGTAQTMCQEFNGTLGRIESETEQELIVQYMKRMGVTYFWIDLTDYGTEGSWHWASTGAALSAYQNWWNEREDSPGKNCAAMYENGAWVQYSCTSVGGDAGYNIFTLCQIQTFPNRWAGFKWLWG